MNKESKYLVTLFLISFILRIIFFDTSYFMWDETVYLLNAKLYAGQTVGYEETFLRPPLLSLILSPFARLFQENYEVLAKTFIILLNSLIIIPTYYLGRLINKKSAIISASIITILPVSIMHSRFILTDHLGVILALTTFLFFFNSINGKKYLYFGAFFLGLSILMKFTNLLLFILILPFLFFLRKRVKELSISFLIFLAVILPYLIYNYLKFDNPFYVFIRAFHVITESDLIGLPFIIYLFNDVFGIIFILLILIGFIFFIKHKIINSKKKSLNSTLVYAFLVLLFYFLYIVQKGVDKPATIGWIVERFMLFFIPFALVFAAYFLSLLHTFFKNKKHSLILTIFLIIVSFSLLSSTYMRAYIPQINFEDGLRYTTKDMAQFLSKSNISEISCIGNCPPIAYYSNKETHIFYNINELLSFEPQYIVSFKEIIYDGFDEVKSICKGSSCVYLYKSIL